MGLSFHYKGSINKYSEIDVLTQEVKDICESLDWPYQIFDENLWKNAKSETGKRSINYKVEDLRGISLTPPESETLFFTFLPDKNLCSPVKLIYNNPEINDLMIEVIHTKTQFAGPDTHIALMKLLKYLKEKYISDLDVDDEGYYWRTWDEKALLEQFRKYNLALEIVTGALQGFKTKPGESIQSLANRIEDLLRGKLNNGLI